MVVTIVNIFIISPSWYNNTIPNNKNAHENNNAGAGTPLIFNKPNKRGAALECDKPNSIRPVENIPPFADDNADDNTNQIN